MQTSQYIYYYIEDKLVRVDKASGELQVLLTNTDYETLPLAVQGSNLLVRARVTRGSERFELWGLDAASGSRTWQIDMGKARPVEPPDELVGLVDEDQSGFTWKLDENGLVLLRFEAAPNQVVVQTIDPAKGTVDQEITVPLKAVSGDFYAAPKLIGWEGQLRVLHTGCAGILPGPGQRRTDLSLPVRLCKQGSYGYPPTRRYWENLLEG